MKKIIYSFAVLGLLFVTACDPLEDVNKEIDAMADPIVGNAIYTLTDADYDELGLSYGNFSSIDDAKSELPPFLKNMFPVWGKGSSALIEYKLYVGNAPGVSDYTYADKYQLTDEDYVGAGTDAELYKVFTAASPVDINLPRILASKIDAPSSGDIVLAKYKYAEAPSDPSVIHSMVNDDYMLIVDAVANHSDPLVSGLVSSYGDSELYTGASAYYGNFDTRLYKREGQADYDLLTSDEERTAFVDARVQEGIKWFLQAKFPNAVPEINGQTVYYVITYKTYNGDNAYPTVIYKCISEGPDPEFELVEGPGEDVVYQASTVTEKRGDFYTYNGTKWEKNTDVIFLGSGDFDSMGEAYGQPGYYNNFSSSISPSDYLPTFLGINYPYGLDGDELYVIYDYYSSSSGAQIRGNLYTANGGEWNGFQSTITTTLQFGHDGSTWVPDNTIKYEFVGADYDYVVSTFTGVDGFGNAVSNLSSYGNFSMFNWTEDQVDAAINAVLKHNYPGMEEGQKFAVTIYVYDGSSHNLTINYILSGGTYIRNN